MLNWNNRTWFKGNLHMHTTRSDGAAEPGEAIRQYRALGYDCLALTDHFQFSDTRRDNGMTLLSGLEYDVGLDVRKGIYHIVGIGMTDDPGLQPDRQPDNLVAGAQRLIDAIVKAGGMAILAHPAWSLETPQQILPLRDLHGVELYNTFSGLPRNVRPDSSLIIDQLAAAGRLLTCLAADDTHLYETDVGGSFVWLEAEDDQPETLLAALRDGRLVASQGPCLTVHRDGGAFRVECTPAEQVLFYSDVVYRRHRVFLGNGMTEAVYLPADNETYVRCQVIDAEGRSAWSSPLAV